MSDWNPNKLNFDSAGVMNEITQIIDFNLDELSLYMQRIVRTAIVAIGNGSKIMRLFAAAVVEETKREITNDHVMLEVGIKMADLPEDGFVRVSVVLSGNQSEGPLMTKPGQTTWGKHVIGKGMSTARSSYPLPDGFNQGDQMENILDMIYKNVENDTNKYVNAFINNVNKDLKSIDFSKFITVG